MHSEQESTKQLRQPPIPEPTLRRLPLYLAYLKQQDHGEDNNISCTNIAQALNLIPIQVRKDLAYTGIVGRPKTGYNAAKLRTSIENFLGWDNRSDALLFGAGHLGLALLSYAGFSDYGINIVAAVDSDPAKAGQTINGKKIIPLHKAASLITRLHIHIGILAVPAQAAQETADMIVKAGIRAIWNFAPVKVTVPPDVILQHENLASSLAVLSKKLALSVAGKQI